MTPPANSEVIKVRDLVVDFETHRVLNGVNVELYRGEILGFVGASGAGKSTLARTIIGLLPKRAGTIEVLGVDIDKASHEQKRAIDRRWGVLFQQGALFSSLTVGKNIEFPIREYLRLSNRLTTEMAIAKLEMVGLSPDVYREYPSELSGGMIKRAALARALALDPEILFLDEPTSGLDPISAGEFDALILTLQQTLGSSVLMVTHDLDSLFSVTAKLSQPAPWTGC
jgi:phospholipid/cholesterol/gamma-HCH transport system ATP-binding protein